MPTFSQRVLRPSQSGIKGLHLYRIQIKIIAAPLRRAIDLADTKIYISLLRTILIYSAGSLLRSRVNKCLFEFIAERLIAMWTTFMAIEQEAIAWLLAIAFEAGGGASQSAWMRWFDERSA